MGTAFGSVGKPKTTLMDTSIAANQIATQMATLALRPSELPSRLLELEIYELSWLIAHSHHYDR